MEKPNCSKCKHYFITWDKQTPYGCRIYGIKTQDRPSTIVKAAGGGECQGYEPKLQNSSVNRDQGYGS